MLVECPSCHTKFAIELKTATAKKARFHCSRCDFYFEATPQEQTPKVEEKTKSIDSKKSEKLSFNLKDFRKKDPQRKAKKSKNAIKIDPKDDNAFQISLDLDKRGPEIISNKRALLLTSAIPACICILIGSLAWKTNHLPKVIRQSLLLDIVGLDQVAPNGIEVSDISLQENPARGTEIQGVVMNTTLDSFSDIKIKTIFYDKSNNKIREIISKQDKTFFANSKERFRIPLGERNSESAWFSASVYSVKKVPL